MDIPTLSLLTTFTHVDVSYLARRYLLMRAKCVGPARVNKKAYCATYIYNIYARCAIYAICTLYIAHTAHLFLHTFCIYNEV